MVSLFAEATQSPDQTPGAHEKPLSPDPRLRGRATLTFPCLPATHSTERQTEAGGKRSPARTGARLGPVPPWLWVGGMWQASGHCACSLAPCPLHPGCRGGHDSGLEYETFSSLPVAQGYSFSLLQGNTSLALLATWATGLRA